MDREAVGEVLAMVALPLRHVDRASSGGFSDRCRRSGHRLLLWENLLGKDLAGSARLRDLLGRISS